MKNNSINYFWGKDHLIISLGNRTNFRIKALYLIEFIIISGMATLLLLQSIGTGKGYMAMAADIGAGLLYVLAAYRFLARMFFNELIVLDEYALTLIRRSLFSRQEKQIYWYNVCMLHYAGMAIKTDHPLKGKCYDYFGFDTQEQLVQNLHNPGNLYVDTLLGRVYFASGVYSWDAEEMVQMMKLYAGKRLRLGPEWEEMQALEEYGDINSNI